MSELDFELETASTENDLPSTKADSSFENDVLDSEQAGNHCIKISICSENEEFVEEKLNVSDQKRTEFKAKDGEIDSEHGDSGRELDDLEEGEVDDSNTEEPNQIVCRFFKNGKCRFGQQCRFIHIGSNAYKMFDSQFPSKCLPAQTPTDFYPPSYFPPSAPNVAVISDAWEQALLKAKKLLQIAKDKKERDLEFEEKKLYLSVEEKEIIRALDSGTQKTNMTVKKDKHSKSQEINLKSTKYKHVKESKPRKLPKTLPSSQSWSDPWRRSRSRTRNRSRSFSSSSSSQSTGHRPGSCSSLCSLCNSASDEDSTSEKRFPKSTSKLNRVFARTFSDQHTRSDSSSSSSSLHRSLYKKRSARRSHSRSSSADIRRSKMYPEKKTFKVTPPKVDRSKIYTDKKTYKDTPPKLGRTVEICQQQKRKCCSPVSSDIKPKKSFKSGWESCSSDMTISSLNCTSFSGSNTHSSVEGSPESDGKRKRKFVDEKHKKSLWSDINLLQSYRKIEFASGYDKKHIKDKIISPVEPLISSSSPEVTNKNVKRKTEMLIKDKIVSPVNKLKSGSSSEATNKNVKRTTEKNSTPDSSKQSKKKSCGKTDKFLSEAENQLLRYMPLSVNNSNFSTTKPLKKQTGTNLITKSNTSTSTVRMNLKPKPAILSTVASVFTETSPEPLPKSLSRREYLMMQLKAVELAIAKRKRMASPQK